MVTSRHRPPHSISKASGSISMKTRRKVACEGTPLARVKKDCSQPGLLRPESAMSSQLSAHAITAHTAITRISVSRCSTLPAHRGSARAEKCSTSFSADIAILPSSIKGEPAQPVSPSEPARPFHALPLSPTRGPAGGLEGGSPGPVAPRDGQHRPRLATARRQGAVPDRERGYRDPHRPADVQFSGDDRRAGATHEMGWWDLTV